MKTPVVGRIIDVTTKGDTATMTVKDDFAFQQCFEISHLIGTPGFPNPGDWVEVTRENGRLKVVDLNADYAKPALMLDIAELRHEIHEQLAGIRPAVTTEIDTAKDEIEETILGLQAQVHNIITAMDTLIASVANLEKLLH